MSSRIVLRNATVFDSVSGTLTPNLSVLVDGDRIVDVGAALPALDDAQVFDVRDHTLLPGLIDGHVHVTATMPDFFKLTLTPQSLITAQAKDILLGILMRGFTRCATLAGRIRA